MYVWLLCEKVDEYSYTSRDEETRNSSPNEIEKLYG